MTLVTLMAISVIMLALPDFRASYRYLPVEFALERYYSSREIPSDRIDVLADFANQSVVLQDRYRYHNGLSQLYLLRAIDMYTPALERRPAYRRAEQESIESLRANPAQPGTWLLLTRIRWILHDEPDDIIAAWKMSIFTGRTASNLITERVEIGIAHRGYMDQEGVALLRDQLLLAWRMQPGTLMRALHRRDHNLAITRGLIEDSDPAALQEMEAWVAKLR